MAEVVHILDGAVALYQRQYMGAQTWTARYKIRGMKGYVTCATGKRDLEEAKEVAREKHAELTADFRRGIPIQNKTFQRAVDAYLEDLAAAVASDKTKPRTQRDNKAVIDRYLLPYFKGKAIDAIRQEQIESYKLWRLKYWTSGPGAEEQTREYMRGGKLIKAKRPPKTQTQRSGEILVLKAIFKSALKRKWIKREQIPDIEEDGREHRRRPAFLPSEWKRVAEAMGPYIESAKGDVVKHDRKMVCAYMDFMFETGLRPGKEHQQLTWADCELGAHKTINGPLRVTYIHVQKDTKTGSRLVVASQAAWDTLNHIRSFSPWTKPTDPVFADRATGKPIKSLSRGMETLLKTAGLEQDRYGSKYSPYSLRHSYATDRLINGRVDVWLLAKNMGTSVEMIRKHYGQDEPRQRAEELTHDKMQLVTSDWLRLMETDPDMAAAMLRRANANYDGPNFDYDPEAETATEPDKSLRQPRKSVFGDMFKDK